MIAEVVDTILAIVRAGVAAGRSDAEIRAQARSLIQAAIERDAEAVAALHERWRQHLDRLWPQEPRQYVGDSVRPVPVPVPASAVTHTAPTQPAPPSVPGPSAPEAPETEPGTAPSEPDIYKDDA